MIAPTDDWENTWFFDSLKSPLPILAEGFQHYMGSAISGTLLVCFRTRMMQE